MGFRVRKSFQLAPGVHMTVTPKGVGVSAGGRGARVSMNTSGRVSRTVSIPGTGISHVKTYGGSGGNARARSASKTRAVSARTAARPDAPQVAPIRPGLFAPKWEKGLFKAIEKGDSVAVEAQYSEFPDNPTVCWVATVIVWLPNSDWGSMHRPMEELWRGGFDPLVDPFVEKYLSSEVIDLPLSDVVRVSIPPDRATLGLILAEARQAIGDIAGAIDVVEGLPPTTLAAVSLVELYALTERWSDVVELTDGLSNSDELSTYLLIQRGVAFRELAFYEASREALKTALAPRSRSADLRNLAFVERSMTYLAEGKKSQARKDLERVLAGNAGYPGLREKLAELNAG